VTACGYFVTGTDTGVGKTLVSVSLLQRFAAEGLRAVGMKPVAAGCDLRDGRLVNDDVEALRAGSNFDAPPDLVNPYAFQAPIAPHIAARQVGENIELGRIRECYDALARETDVVVVEGAGGIMVPLNETETMADLAVELRLPLILVVGMRLGCLSHALLTLEAIQHRGLTLAGWVANRIDPHMTFFDANLAALEQRIPAPLLGVIPHLTALDISISIKWFITLPAWRRVY
jgi:dethiobiotin synthetase